jgi:cell division protein FtsX
MEHPSFKAYSSAKLAYDEALSGAGYSILNLVESKMEYMEKRQIRRQLLERLEELRDYHLAEKKAFLQNKNLVDLFNPYSELVMLSSGLMPSPEGAGSPEILSFHAGNMDSGPQPATFMSLLSSTVQRLRLEKSLSIPELVRYQGGKVENQMCAGLPLGYMGMFTNFGYPGFALVNFDRGESYARYALPIEEAFMRDTKSMENSLKILGETVLSLAHGVGLFRPSGTSYWLPRTFGGRVLVSNVGQSVVPNYPLKDALVTARGVINYNTFSLPGHYIHLLKYTDPYGRYYLPNNSSDFVCWWQFYRTLGYSPVAAAYDKNGMIAYMKDEGEEGQRLYKSVRLPIDAKKWAAVSIVTFRSTPVTIFDIINPQTMNVYSNVELVSQKNLLTFSKQCVYTDGRMYTTFIEPHERFYAIFRAGSPDNELAQVIRAFALGVPQDFKGDPEDEIDGPGYLAADNNALQRVPFEVARSMAYLNGKRLDLQNRYGMADERTNEYHVKSSELSIESKQERAPLRETILKARESVTYSTLNHPVIRGSIQAAVIGIVWYLGLLVPFCFFFEKLVFGFPDIRKQIAANAVIFISVFALLWFLHPAFQMVRSSLMILLGFIIILISGGITLLFFGKFQENLEQLRKSQGKVSAAEVNTGGAISSAFMLGLNNMHRRKVRTGLTCVTLVLMTFVMICFSSVQTNLVDETIALGRAPYQGILVKKENFREIKSLNALHNEYGQDYEICPRTMVFGSQDWQERRSTNPELSITYDGGAQSRKLEFDSIIQLAHNEPLRDEIEFVTKSHWFTPEHQNDSEILPIFIPDRMADELGVMKEQIDAGEKVEVRINGRHCQVRGIFSATSYDNLKDLDGLDLLPYDMEAMPNVVIEGKTGDVLVTPEDPRVPASRIVIAPYRSDIRISANNTRKSAEGRIGVPVSVVIKLNDVPYGEAKALIDSYLERKAEPVFYGLAGVAYSGKRTRESSLAGVVELIIPLFIAALTVLNTMRGSVYERRDEIFVYNAVGIAPKYVFAMFFAEAFVYAVVGSVMGYILSQGVGVFLTAINLTGGLNMSFTSLATILASLAISFAVFFSTFFPAMSAMEIASPAEESGWKLPEPEGDTLTFRLPFTFNHRDHIAILAFFDRYLRDHGEGSAGRFYSGVPEVGVHEKTDPLAGESYIPELDCTVWLKPFDLAVSQRMRLILPTDHETGEYIAEIQLIRLSGSRESWLRLNKGFVRLVRRHFLHWRAVADSERQEMFEESRALMMKAYSNEMVTVNHG